MTEISLPQRKAIMLDIMDAVDAFCRKNKISYFLLGGSLIGAVRHQGYIPWDDDLDIGMLRPDYDRFIQSFQAENLKLVSFETNPAYYLPQAKVYDTRTYIDEGANSSVPIGVFVDVFPIDYCGESEQEACKFAQSIEIYRKLLTIKNVPLDKRRGIIKNAILLLAKVVTSPIRRQKILQKITSLSALHKKDAPMTFAGELALMIYGNREIYRTEWLEKTIEANFENRRYLIPKDYDCVLTTTFGDYMKLPPEEQRVSHHCTLAWYID